MRAIFRGTIPVQAMGGPGKQKNNRIDTKNCLKNEEADQIQCSKKNHFTFAILEIFIFYIFWRK